MIAHPNTDLMAIDFCVEEMEANNLGDGHVLAVLAHITRSDDLVESGRRS